jgi:hypothetical protein
MLPKLAVAFDVFVSLQDVVVTDPSASVIISVCITTAIPGGVTVVTTAVYVNVTGSTTSKTHPVHIGVDKSMVMNESEGSVAIEDVDDEAAAVEEEEGEEEEEEEEKEDEGVIVVVVIVVVLEFTGEGQLAVHMAPKARHLWSTVEWVFTRSF